MMRASVLHIHVIRIRISRLTLSCVYHLSIAAPTFDISSSTHQHDITSAFLSLTTERVRLELVIASHDINHTHQQQQQMNETYAKYEQILGKVKAQLLMEHVSVNTLPAISSTHAYALCR